MKKSLILIAAFLLLPFILKGQSDSIGVYLRSGNEIQRVLPLKYIQTKSNTLATALTGGIASTSIKTVFPGSTSKNIANKESIFLFFFPSTVPLNVIQTYFMFSIQYSPADFIVAQMKPKKKTRELSVGKVGAFAGVTMGTSEDTNIELNVKSLREGVYELSFSNDPEPGEYCFVFLGAHGAGGFLPVFDFKIE